MKTPQERAEELYKYSPNDSIEIPSYIKGRQEERAEWQEKVRWIPVEERLPEINRKVEIKYTTGSMSPSIIIQLGYLKENGKFTGEMDWVYATHWREII